MPKAIGASYVAEVGVSVDKNALKYLQGYLDNVELKVKRFEERLNKFRGIHVKVRIDKLDLHKKIKAAVAKAPALLHNVRLATASIQKIKDQLTRSINNLHFSPRWVVERIKGLRKLDIQIEPKIKGPLNVKDVIVSGRLLSSGKGISVGGGRERGEGGPSFTPVGTVGDGSRGAYGGAGGGGGGGDRGGRGRGGFGGNSSRNNVLGGFGGGVLGSPLTGRGGLPAIISYGPRALVGVSGVYGLAAMESKAADISREKLMMFQAAKGNQSEADQILTGIQSVSKNLSVLPSDIMPDFARFYTGMRSKGMEKDALRGFESVLQLATVSGASATDIKGITRALHQIVSKGQFMAEELKQQMSEHGVPQVIDILTEVVTGDKRNTKQLYDMMQKGDVTVDKYMVPFLEAVRREAEPGLTKYRGSLMESSNKFGTRADFFARALLGNDAVVNALKDFNNNMSDWLTSATNNVGRLGELTGSLIDIGRYIVDGFGGAVGLLDTFITSFTEGSTLWSSLDDILSRYFGDSGETESSFRNLGILFNNLATILGNTLSLGLDTKIGMNEALRSRVVDTLSPAVGWVADRMRDIGLGSTVDDLSRISGRFFGPDSMSMSDIVQDSTVAVKARSESFKRLGNSSRGSALEAGVSLLRDHSKHVMQSAIDKEVHAASMLGSIPSVDAINRNFELIMGNKLKNEAHLSAEEVDLLDMSRFFYSTEHISQELADTVNASSDNLASILENVDNNTYEIQRLLSTQDERERESLNKKREELRNDLISQSLDMGAFPRVFDIENFSDSDRWNTGGFSLPGLNSYGRVGDITDFRGVDPEFGRPLEMNVNVSGSISVDGDITTSSIDVEPLIEEKTREAFVRTWGLNSNQNFGGAS